MLPIGTRESRCTVVSSSLYIGEYEPREAELVRQHNPNSDCEWLSLSPPPPPPRPAYDTSEAFFSPVHYLIAINTKDQPLNGPYSVLGCY